MNLSGTRLIEQFSNSLGELLDHRMRSAVTIAEVHSLSVRLEATHGPTTGTDEAPELLLPVPVDSELRELRDLSHGPHTGASRTPLPCRAR